MQDLSELNTFKPRKTRKKDCTYRVEKRGKNQEENKKLLEMKRF